jgi:hypothetical protein
LTARQRNCRSIQGTFTSESATQNPVAFRQNFQRPITVLEQSIGQIDSSGSKVPESSICLRPKKS